MLPGRLSRKYDAQERGTVNKVPRMFRERRDGKDPQRPTSVINGLSIEYPLHTRPV